MCFVCQMLHSISLTADSSFLHLILPHKMVEMYQPTRVSLPAALMMTVIASGKRARQERSQEAAWERCIYLETCLACCFRL